MRKYIDYEEIENGDDDLAKELDFDNLVLEAQLDYSGVAVPKADTMTGYEDFTGGKKMAGGAAPTETKDMSKLKL